jgi:hypothetical protein
MDEVLSNVDATGNCNNKLPNFGKSEVFDDIPRLFPRSMTLARLRTCKFVRLCTEDSSVYVQVHSLILTCQ